MAQKPPAVWHQNCASARMKLAQLLLISLLYALTPFQKLLAQNFWQQSAFHLASTAPAFCIQHSTTNDVLLVGTLGDGLWRSTDGGGNWNRVFSGTEGNYIYSLERHNNQWWAGTDSGILRSSNDGLSWTFEALSTNFPVVDLLYTPEGALYASTTDFWGSELSGSGIFRSNDGGISWQQLNSGLPSLAVRYLARSSNGRLFAALTGSDAQGQAVSLAYSDNGGAGWQAHPLRIRSWNDSLPAPIRVMEWQSLVVAPNDSLWISFQGIYSDGTSGAFGVECMAVTGHDLPYWTYTRSLTPAAWWWMQSGLAGIHFTQNGHQLGSWRGIARGGPWLKTPGSQSFRNIKSGIIPSPDGWLFNEFTEDGAGRIYAIQAWEPGVYFSDSLRHSPLALPPASTFENFKLGPNPSYDLLYISFNSSATSSVFYRINNMQGQNVLAGSWQAQPQNEVQLDVSKLAPGTYLLQLRQDRRFENRRIIVAR